MLMNPVLEETLRSLWVNKTRVAVTYRSKFGSERKALGYIAHVSADFFTVRFREHASSSNWIGQWDTVTEIRATTGKRRKHGLYYETYYRELPYVPAADGGLDMTATLKGLLATA